MKATESKARVKETDPAWSQILFFPVTHPFRELLNMLPKFRPNTWAVPPWFSLVWSGLCFWYLTSSQAFFPRVSSPCLVMMIRQSHGHVISKPQSPQWLQNPKELSNSRTGKPGVLQSTGTQRVGHNWATEQQKLFWFSSCPCYTFHLSWQRKGDISTTSLLFPDSQVLSKHAVPSGLLPLPLVCLLRLQLSFQE